MEGLGFADDPRMQFIELVVNCVYLFSSWYVDDRKRRAQTDDKSFSGGKEMDVEFVVAEPLIETHQIARVIDVQCAL
jgi:hypothetical protein